jgi:hypothetical protein
MASRELSSVFSQPVWAVMVKPSGKSAFLILIYVKKPNPDTTTAITTIMAKIIFIGFFIYFFIKIFCIINYITTQHKGQSHILKLIDFTPIYIQLGALPHLPQALEFTYYRNAKIPTESFKL